MMIRHSTWLQLLVLLAVSFLAHTTWAQTKEDGFKSAVFDPKYIPFQELLITPKTHPGLFSFTGRWHRRRFRYSASSWPGSSLTTLIYGQTCIVKLRPQHVGIIPAYTFYVSIDGGPDRLYTLPGFDTLDPDREIIYVPLTIPLTEEGRLNATTGEWEKDNGVDERVLQPHTVRVTSVTDTPFSFEGYLVENTLVHQGSTWTDLQDDRLVIEFIGEGVDAEIPGGLLGYLETTKTHTGGIGEGFDVTVSKTSYNDLSLLKSVQYKVAERMGVRHIHISSNTCLVDFCNPSNPYPGLGNQYFHENPVSPSLGSEVLRKGSRQWQQSLQQAWQVFASIPWVSTTTPDAVVVDMGVRDLLLHNVPPEIYGRELMVFLGKLRENARPEAKIVVVGREWKGSVRGWRSMLADDLGMTRRRQKLFEVTREAVEAVMEEDDNLVFLALPSTPSPLKDLSVGLCQTLITPPLPGIPPNRPQKYCASINALSSSRSTRHTFLPHKNNSNAQESRTTRFFTLYALGLTVAVGVILYLLVKPMMVCLGIGLGGKGGRRVYGVRDVEGAVFGMGRSKKSWTAEKKV